MTHRSATTSDSALTHLRALLEVNEQVARDPRDFRLEGHLNEEVKEVLDLVMRTVAGHRDEIADLIRAWETSRRDARPATGSSGDPLMSPRELIESWLAIKEGAVEIYRTAAADAPSAMIRRRLRDLAHEDEVQAEKLRRLL